MIRKILAALAEKYLPTRTIRVNDSRHDPPSVAELLDVDMLHGILDEARSGNTQRLFAVYRDLVLGHSHGQSELNTRKLAVVGEHPIFEPLDKTDPGSTQARDLVETCWQSYPEARNAVTHLLDSCLWPVALVEKTFRRSTKPGLRYELAGLRPVPYHLLDYTEGRLRIQDVSPQGVPMGTYHEPDPRRYIIHRGHLMTSIPDNFGGPMRAALFWWLFSTMDRDWWIRFLERFGAPFIVGKYDPADEGARGLLTHAFSAATRLFGLVVSRDTQVELHSAQSATHGDAFEQFHDAAKKELSKLILGQTMTSEAQAGGLGGTQAVVHDGVRADIKKFDALALGDTLRHQLFRQLLDINGLAKAPAPNVSWGSDQADAKIIAETIETLNRGGLRPTAESLADISLDLGFAVERITGPLPPSPGQASPDLLSLFAASASRNPGADAVDQMAQIVARDIAAKSKRRLRAALASAESSEQFEAAFKFPTEADLAAQMLVASAVNALSR